MENGQKQQDPADGWLQVTVKDACGQNILGTVKVLPGRKLLDVCRENRIGLEAACNGNGTCGKCRVRIQKGDAPATKDDRNIFSSQELADGYRLACRVEIFSDLAVCVGGGLETTRMQTLGLSGSGFSDAAADREKERVCMIAADLGSTTLAAVLLAEDGTVLGQESAVNTQRSYGADVISRIQASNEGKREALRDCICRDLAGLFQSLVTQFAKTYRQTVRVSKIAVAANTTMMHLLRGYSCETLGAVPFTPVNLGLECLPYREVFAECADGPACPACGDSMVYLLCGMSAFAGADVTAGLYSSGFWQTPEQECAFFVDFGTNGELACGNRAGFVTASAAAGPAFEGGRLSCGIPGIPGAISDVSFFCHRVRIRTIGQKKPCGICGTGALSAAAALRQEHRMDAEGLLEPQLFANGFVLASGEDGRKICLTQADIREIQMAKAAIRAGIEILQEGVQVDRVYLAGGFGNYLQPETAFAIGLFPPEWKGKVILCGNTSLKGAVAFLTDDACGGALEEICGKNETVRLEECPSFADLYLRKMRFPSLP